MSRHFGLQLLCHLTSQLFHKKGHSMRKHTKTQTHTCALLASATHILAHSGRARKKHVIPPNAYLASFYSQNARPRRHISRPPTRSRPHQKKKKWHCAVCTAQNPVPTAREVSYITLINWDSARQMVSSKKRSGLIWIERGCQILNIKDLTAKMAKKIYIYKNLKHLTPKVHFSFKSASVWSTAKTTSCILHAVSVPPVMAVNNE